MVCIPGVSRYVGMLDDLKRREAVRPRDIYDDMVASYGVSLATSSERDLARLVMEQVEREGTRRGSVEWTLVGSVVVGVEFIREAANEFPLTAPRMLEAAREHGVDERILREVRKGVL